jgi:hypothetical protein
MVRYIVANYWFTEFVGSIPTCLINYLILLLSTVSLHHCLKLLIDFRLHSLTEWLVKLQQSTDIIFRSAPYGRSLACFPNEPDQLLLCIHLLGEIRHLL